MNTKRAHVVLPDQLLKDIDRLVGTRQRSSFITKAVEQELLRLRQHEALLSTVGAWKDENHPELKGGSAQWVGKMRKQDEVVFQKTQRARNLR